MDHPTKGQAFVILVAGATGNIGSGPVGGAAHIRCSSAAGPDARRLTGGVPAGVEAVEGDVADTASLKPALEGVRSLFLVSRLGSDAEILDAARQAGVEHVVLVSSITVQTHPHLGPADENIAVERLLKDSGMAWTILRPTQFASNTMMWAASIRDGQAVRMPYGDIGLPTIHPRGHRVGGARCPARPSGRTYTLTGPE